MQCLIQRVRRASVTVAGETIAAIEHGLLAFVGIDADDTDAVAEQCSHKLLHYRVFADAAGRMNRNVMAVEGGVLLVSQFTLSADTNSGLRPSFSRAAPPEQARACFDHLVRTTQQRYARVETGQFAADMQVELINDGPVTFLFALP